MTTLTREALRLDFADYEEAEQEAERFVKWLLARNHFNKDQLLSGEGSAAHMVETTIAYIVTENDIGKGIKEYYKQLAAEYDRKLNHNRNESLTALAPKLDTILGEETVEPRGSGFVAAIRSCALPPSALQVLQDMSQIEWDVMETAAAVGMPTSPGNKATQGGIREVAALLDVPLPDVRKAYRRVKARAKWRLTHTLSNT